MANYCQYHTLLDDVSLSAQGYSLSISLLTICLLDGEILDNGVGGPQTSGLSISKILRKSIFRHQSTTQRLTFNEGCRLTDVSVISKGIATRGHLWRLGPIIDTTKFRRNLPRINEPKGRLTLI
ncbi:hypothetical protein GCG54_00015329 [Colletotrichum gloeosporioides]|uniref:Uncharacterized protein n=1 Tax=Colletotrichum gloeosporioides TaxID=474922 RepID=A0A8H4FEN9_COLGL|nr:uncharacterized protein GCG54_00015329 [Colletotrichum gloeosporioides]KAF3799145.1 hypothetical protein GCG54_00015329 [Colletotrichum gloeosporioides]